MNRRELSPCVKRKQMREESLGVARREETNGGRKLEGCVQRGDGWRKKARKHDKQHDARI